MKFVQKEFSFTYEEKKSKFIAYLLPYEEFDKTMQQLKKDHPKARHHVYAYRHLNEHEQIVENSSDDGEPRGTSGKPCLAVLAGNELINCAVIVVRYFGGIKLGTGGLVRAYSEAVNNVIANSEFIIYQKKQRCQLVVNYTHLSLLEYQANTHNIQILKKEFEAEVKLILEGTKEAFIAFEKHLPLGIALKNC